MPSPMALPGVSKIVAVGSGKGGVGKTTVAVNLAIALSKLGKRVGLIDADIYGPNVPLMMGSTQQPRVGEGNMIQPNDTHGIKTISIGYIYCSLIELKSQFLQTDLLTASQKNE